jgi:hypothetical protein
MGKAPSRSLVATTGQLRHQFPTSYLSLENHLARKGRLKRAESLQSHLHRVAASLQVYEKVSGNCSNGRMTYSLWNELAI